MTMRVRRATANDAGVLSAFGRRVFGETFAPANNPEDLRAYLDSAYVETRQEEELRDPRIDTLLLEETDDLIAFAQLREGPPGNGVIGERPIELWRFYVDFAWHGRGIAQTLMAAVEEAARSRGAGTLWLGVWERNVRAQGFYRKAGFTVVGSQIFVLGSDAQRDLIMAKQV
jgi:ribosomal protein S18 acetylase RimI-like enzyme